MSLLKVILLLLTFSVVWLFPSTIDGVKVVMVNRQVSIKTNKNFPPHIAFIAMSDSLSREQAKTKKQEMNYRVVDLSEEKKEKNLLDPRPNLEKMVLPSLTIAKETRVIYQAQQKNDSEIRNESTVQSINNKVFYNNKIDSYGNYINRRPASLAGSEEYLNEYSQGNAKESSWMNELKPFIRKKFGQYSDKEIEDLFKDEAQEEKQAGARAELDSGNLFAAAKEYVDQKFNKDKEAQPESKSSIMASAKNVSLDANSVVGLLEIKDGLAVTNEHHIEVRRYEEGAFKEKGTVNLVNGTYQLQIESPKGFILARLVAADGKILGEGIGRVSDVVWSKTSYHSGPKIDINKKQDIKGKTISAYQLDKPQNSIEKGTASIFNNYLNQKIAKDGTITFDNIVSGSSTVLVSENKNHLPSQQIILASSEFENISYPQKMIEALKAMVSEQRQQNLNDKNLSVIMGQVVFDKKPMSGVAVEIENYSDIEPIYFNSFVLPEKNLKLTSENGYFAFIGAPEDLHHIVAKRSEKYFSHVNVTVNPGVVSYARLENSIKTETVDIKVYDAFLGEAKPAEVNLQSLEEKVEVSKEGFRSVFLPSVERWSLLHAQPEADYLSAYYTYSDKTDFINVPLISKMWLSYLFAELKINVHPQSAMVIGFVHDEDFTVELPENEQLKNNILYFDYAGRIIKNKSGNLGGGFILYNLPPNIYEVLVLGAKSQKIYSRVAPLKSQEAFVFNYKLDTF